MCVLGNLGHDGRVDERVDEGVDEGVWYASYGSNMWWARFRCYLEGGVPPGGTRVHEGARDPSPPAGSRAVRLPYRMYFAGRAAGWDGGGVSFLDHDQLGHDDPACAWGRAWRITREQFDDVVAQENGVSPGSLDGDLRAMGPGDWRLVAPGAYGRLVLVDHLDGVPMVTFTSPRPLAEADLHAPAGAYLRTLARGLAEMAAQGEPSLDDAAIAGYLAGSPGSDCE